MPPACRAPTAEGRRRVHLGALNCTPAAAWVHAWRAILTCPAQKPPAEAGKRGEGARHHIGRGRSRGPTAPGNSWSTALTCWPAVGRLRAAPGLLKWTPTVQRKQTGPHLRPRSARCPNLHAACYIRPSLAALRLSTAESTPPCPRVWLCDSRHPNPGAPSRTPKP